jgi:hypothetical protein
MITTSESDSCEFRAAHFIKVIPPDIAISSAFRGLWNGWYRTNDIHEVELQEPRGSGPSQPRLRIPVEIWRQIN